MAYFFDPILNPVRQSVGGLTFQEARTRDGIRLTVRTKPHPTDRRSKKQLAARDRFKASTAATREMGPGLYRPDWGDVVGAVPGFSYLVGRFQVSSRSTLEEVIMDQPVPNAPLGNLHTPANITTAIDTNGDVLLGWSTELGTNGQTNDIAIVRGFQANWPREQAKTRPFPVAAFDSNDGLRSGSFVRFDVSGNTPAATGLFTILYFRPGPGSSTTEPSQAIFTHIPI